MSDQNWIFQSRKLRNVRRCGVLAVNSPQSVAEHSFYVALIAKQIALDLEEGTGQKVCVQTLLEKALFHDIEEGITGDIPYPVKYSSQPLHEMLEFCKDKLISEFFPSWIVQRTAQAKQGLEGRIVHMADYVELYIYCAEESVLGNRNLYLEEIKQTCRRICESDSELFEFVEPLLQKVDGYFIRGGLLDENKRISDGKVG